MKLADRLLTIVITATLTSAVWIVFGTSWFDMAEDRQDEVASEEMGDAGAMANLEQAGDRVDPTGPASPDAEARAAKYRIPVEGVAPGELTDSFLDARGADGRRAHEGIDIMAPAGTEVLAAADGTVEKLFVSDRGGNTIYVRSPDRQRIHYYAHLGEYAEGLSEGDSVDAGRVLGTIGSSGTADADGPHLHFGIFETTEGAEWWEPATPVNPYPLLTALAPGEAP